ncbi:MsnO8 family LLM class oxidoreductase [Paenibacillus lentus]|uniref:MsnO8 family LLM class oxidoreductase n=1 Tax=Paenibacillus lentus TaxID=1338368 RepID=A0A3S8RZA9_9BACL|nr:MsnO8 family LLM class oxidoreductase [Paenibacillus lentus]AZK48282.1 MsnO8 family LLM class oxidoreductase [Paenibacillus lentus]
MPVITASTHMPLQLSVLDLVPRLPESTDEEALRQAVALAQHAEKWSYARYWTAEHHDMPGLASSSPEVLLAHVGAKTERIRLGSGAVLLPHYSPLKVAEWFRLLAALYPGRVDLGLGRAPGGEAHAVMALSGNFLKRVAELPKTIGSLLELLQNNYKYDGHAVIARPEPQIEPVVWMLGTNMKSAEYAAKFGTGYVFGHFMSERDGTDVLDSYRASFRPTALQSEPKTMLAVSVVCAATEEEAAHWEQVLDNTAGQTGRSSFHNIIGMPHSVYFKLKELQHEYSNHEFLIVSPIPDYTARLEGYRLLAEALQKWED